MISWRIDINHRFGGDSINKTGSDLCLKGRLGTPYLIKISAGQRFKEEVLNHISRIYEDPFPWIVFEEGKLLEVDTARRMIGFIPRQKLPFDPNSVSYRDVFDYFSDILHFSKIKKHEIEKSLNQMGFWRLWRQLWRKVHYRGQLALELAFFSQRFKIIFLEVHDSLLMTEKVKVACFEMVRTLCGTFNISILMLTRIELPHFERLRFSLPRKEHSYESDSWTYRAG